MEWTPIIVAAITGAFSVIVVYIQTKKTRKDQKETRRMMEVNEYRTHLMLLIASYPTKADEIFSVGRKYFEDLEGDSFVVPLFEDWLKDYELTAPEWFLEAKKKHPAA